MAEASSRSLRQPKLLPGPATSLFRTKRLTQSGSNGGFGGKARMCRYHHLVSLCLGAAIIAIPSADAFLVPSCAPFQGIRTQQHALFAKKSKKKKKLNDTTVAVNRVARRNYEVIDTLEAGISLLGTEVKSVRDGKMNLRDGYIRPAKNGRSCKLYNVHIGKCSQVGAEYFQHEETRPRDLLVHKEQARKFLQQTEREGMTIVPLKAYWNDKNKLKLQIGLCRGKNVRDKRNTIRERDAKRDERRIIKNFRI